jgi:uncharacterized protein YkwD
MILPPLVFSVFMQVNQERQSVAVAALVPDRCLMATATARANDMLNRNYFAHIAPDGTAPWQTMRANGCSFHMMGENIAEAPDPMFAVNELWNSPEHRQNTLDVHFHKVGIGAAVRPDGTEIFVEDFSD